MRHLLSRCLLICLTLALPGFTAESPTATQKLRLLVPAYFYPAGRGMEDWRRMAKAASELPLVAIANPASGPGERRDPNYTAAIKLASDAGVTVIGYVTTSYGKRPRKEVQAEVDRWFELYPEVKGVFFDEQPSGKDSVEYCAALARGVHESRKQSGALVMSNPGTTCAPEYVTPWSGINLCCLQENKFGLDRYQPAVWTRDVPPAQMVGLVYGEPTLSGMRANLKEALKKRLGYVYVTDRSGDNPWDGLPGYWDLEVAELRRINGPNLLPGLFTEVPMQHWAYDALQQLVQRGLLPDYPDSTYAGKRAHTRLQFAQFERDLLRAVNTLTPAQLQKWNNSQGRRARENATRDLMALQKLAVEFREELGHLGVTPESTAEIIQRLRTKLGRPAR